MSTPSDACQLGFRVLFIAEMKTNITNRVSCFGKRKYDIKDVLLQYDFCGLSWKGISARGKNNFKWDNCR